MKKKFLNAQKREIKTMTDEFAEEVFKALAERLEALDKNREDVLGAVDAECQRLIEEIEKRRAEFTDALKEAYTAEDERLQKHLGEARSAHFDKAREPSAENAEKAKKALSEALAALAVKETYSVDLPEMKLRAKKEFVPPPSAPDNGDEHCITVACDKGFAPGGVLDLGLKVPFTSQERDVLAASKLDSSIKYRVVVSSEDGASVIDEQLLGEAETGSFVPNFLVPETSYLLKVRAEYESSWRSEWSAPVPIRTPKMAELFAWRKCVEGPVAYKRMYSVPPASPSVATKVHRYGDTTLVGNVVLPVSGSVSWGVKLCATGHKSLADGVYVGIAPYDIDQNEDNNEKKCGWYIRCFDMTLFSGPPHCYKEKRYSKGTGRGPHLEVGDEIKVFFDASAGRPGTLSFKYKETLDRAAYEKIPIDKPLVPVVLLYWVDDTVECTFN